MRNLSAVLLLALAGCPYISEKEFVDQLQDWDGDGSISDRFGGPDCKDEDPSILDCDSDEDGELTVRAGGLDCDDEDASVFPGAHETCDGIDQDCDDEIDELEDIEDPPVWVADDDGDTWGDSGGGAERVTACDAPAGYVEESRGRDCNDADPEINPNATEFCDDVDSNCDGDPTADAVDRVQLFADGDGDGIAPLDGTPVARACEATPGQVPAPATAADADCDDGDAAVFPGAPETWYDGIDSDCAGDDDFDQDRDGSPQVVDCDDTTDAIRPGAAEVCDGIDNDCDTRVDDDDDGIDDAVNRSTRFHDLDGDGFGDDADARPYCNIAVTPGWTAVPGDCDDGDETLRPGAEERCDGTDNDCDGGVDEGAIDAGVRYADRDGDGFGSEAVIACSGEPNVVSNDDDCDDADADTWPGAPEVCGDNLRQDCSTLSPYDCDGDGFDAVDDGGLDCDDGRASVNPDAREICDGLDNDCDARFDDQDPNVDLSTIADWYIDADGDGFGDPAQLTIAQACAPRPGEAPNAGDCDDEHADANPDAREACDEYDNDCDGLVDDDDDDRPIGTPTYWLDLDGDTFGNAAQPSSTTCEPLDATWVDNDLDCQPGLADINPFALETCDGLDNDCDGLTDDADDDAALDQWYLDGDGDGYGQSSDAVAACGQPAGRVNADGDCDDFDAARNPGATEVCDGGRDNDCDGLSDDNDPNLAGTVTWWPDADGDGYGDAAALPVLQCGDLPGHVGNADDCDDGDPTRNPGVSELCNSRDDDCDTLVDDTDDSLTNAPLWYRDADVDGWGTELDVVYACAPPSGYRPTSGDCDDDDDAVFPNADETCNGADDDCDGALDDLDDDLVDHFFRDLDGDGVGSVPGDAGCGAPPAGQVAVGGDCDDGDDTVSPLVAEACNGLDDDCDGLVDDSDASVVYTLADAVFDDVDGDGYGDPAAPIARCLPPAGYVANPLDCAPADAARSPAAVEFCNGLDDDCDGADDDNPAVGPLSFADADGDGYGDDSDYLVECTPSSGRAPLGGDCDEVDPLVNPGADEACGNGIDDDCDGVPEDLDPDALRMAWYADGDGDGDGGAFLGHLCFASNATPFPGDCNDADPNVNTHALEGCDGIDSDCDGAADSDDENTLIGPTDRKYRDADADGVVDAVGTPGCGFGPGWSTTPGSDCDDDRDDVFPGATEVCNSVDDNCDGLADDGDPLLVGSNLGWPDKDFDGYGDAGATAIVFCNPVGRATNNGDCDDDDDLRNPGKTEICNSDIDDDCDGNPDDHDSSLVSSNLGYLDDDGDGFGVGSLKMYCDFTTHAPLGGDCDDVDGAVFPTATETCNGDDDDCDGLVDDDDPSRVGGAVALYLDNDGDGAGAGASQNFCTAGVPFYKSAGGDCDDYNPAVSPTATERCNGGLDDDCDGLADDADTGVSGTLVWQNDVDHDGWGDGAFNFNRCLPLPNQVSSAYSGDCLDTDNSVHPGATEVCNANVDDDCDGLADELDGDLTGAAYFADLDGDGYGIGLPTFCSPGINRAANDDDCNDAPGVGASFFPGQSVTVPQVAPVVLGTNLQIAVDSVCSPAEVRVLTATTFVPIDTKGKTIHVRGVGPDARGVVSGAGTLVSQTVPGLSLTDLELVGNDTNTVVLVSNTAVDFDNVVITGGDAPGANAGGGLRATNAQIVAQGLQLVGNIAEVGGGGYIVGGLFACDGCLFQDNLGTTSGGALVTSSAQVLLSDVSFVGNVGTGSVNIGDNGTAGASTLRDLVFEDDDGFIVAGVTTVDGADMLDSGNVTIQPVGTDTVVFRGARIVRGGALFSATVVMQNTGTILFEHNQLLDSYGGDASVTGSNHTVRHNTFLDATDTMLHVVSATPIVRGNVFASTNLSVPTVNGAGSKAGVLYNVFQRSSVPPGVDDVLNLADSRGSYFQTYHPNLPAEYWDVHPTQGSPAIDNGDPLLPVEPDGTTADAGAFGGPTYEPFYINDPIPHDDDDDGLPDAWELYHLGTLAFSTFDDTDGDYLSLYDEYLTGASPTLVNTDFDLCGEQYDYEPLNPLNLCGQ